MIPRIVFLSFLFFSQAVFPVIMPRGIFAVCRTGDSNRIEAALKMNHVDGVVFYTGWRLVEPEKDLFFWTNIDQVFTMAKKYQKPLILAILPGRWSPSWIYDQGAKPVHFKHIERNMQSNTQTNEVRSPIPWDENYLNLFSNCVDQTAARYRNHVSLVAVMATGPSLENGLEANMASVSDEMLNEIGFSEKVFVAAWERMLEHFAIAFPDQRVHVALHPKFGSRTTDKPAQVINNYGFSRFPARYGYHSLYLTHEDWFEPENIAVRLLLKDSARNAMALQLIRIYSTKKMSPNQLDEALKRGMTVGKMRWAEVFLDDVLFADYDQTLQKYHALLAP